MTFLSSAVNILFLDVLIACIIVITIREFTKAFVSSKLGDPLPKRDKRITLNPIKHLEPIGLILLVFFNFGWGKPVETTSLYYKNKKTGTLLTYILPSVVTLIFGILMAILYFNFMASFLITNPSLRNVIASILLQTSIVSLRLTFFNIIPIWPLDGAKVLNVFLKPNTIIKMANSEKVYQIILFVLILMGIVGSIINPIVQSILNMVFTSL